MFDYATHLRPRTRLVRRTIPIAIATVLVAIAGLSLSGSVAASNSDEGVQRCTLATLKGRYLFADAGTLLPPAVPQPTLTAWAGFHVFNGDGTGTATVTVRIGGTIVLRSDEYSSHRPLQVTVFDGTRSDFLGSIVASFPNGRASLSAE